MSCCGDCLSIEILDNVIGITDSMKVNGRTYLDLPFGFSVFFAKGVEELEIESIEGEVSIDFSIDKTDLNQILARQITDKNSISDLSIGYNVIVKEGEIFHSFNKLYFINGGDASRGYTIRLTQGVDSWLYSAANKFLDELNLGSISFDVSTINTLNGVSGYVDGAEGIVFPVVNYGSWASSNDILIEDLRPHVFMLKMLQQGFCEIGWDFRSPILESTKGRQIITYTNSKEFGTNQDLLEERRFEATLGPGNLFFNQEVFDNGGLFLEEGTGKFVDTGTHKFVVELEGYFPGDIYDFEEIYITIRKSNGDIVAEGDVRADPRGELFKIRVEGETTIGLDEYVFAEITGRNAALTVVKAVFYNVPKSTNPNRGQTVSINQFQGRYSLLDYFKGAAHLFNGKITTDWTTKTVTLYSPYEAEYYSETVEGFFIDTIIDWSEKLTPETENVIVDSIDINRFQLFAFKESRDSYIRELNLEEDKPLFSRRVDLGENYVEGEQENRNPFFEPTYNDKLVDFNFVSPLTSNLPIDVPFMLDNNNGELSTDIGPRVLFWGGNQEQVSDDGAITRYWKFEGATTINVPYAYQVSTTSVNDGAVAVPDEVITFESVDNNIYDLFYDREFKENVFTHKYTYDAELKSFDYFSTNFRNKYKGFYDGSTFLFRLLEIPGYKTCSDAPIQIITRPDAFQGLICDTDITYRIVNEALIRVKYDEVTKSIIAERINTRINSPINTDTLEVSIDNGVTYNPYTEGTGVTGAPTIKFRRTVDFTDGSPSSTYEEVGSIEKLCNNRPIIELEFRIEEQSLKAFDNGSIESTVTSDTWTVSLNGQAAIPYNPGNKIYNFETASFTRTVVYADDCPDSVLERTYAVDTTRCYNRPVLNMDEIINCMNVLSIDSANVQAEIAYTEFQLYNPITGKWTVWNGSPFRCEDGVKARAFVYYSGSCPDSVVEAECCGGVGGSSADYLIDDTNQPVIMDDNNVITL